jgi:hypothetical protein
MDVKRMYCMTEKLAECAEKQFDAGIENIDTAEMGQVVDMMKDLSEAMYYRELTKAMQEFDAEDVMEMLDRYGDGRKFYDHYRYADGRFAPKGRGTYRRGYEEPPYYHMTPEMYRNMEQYRDTDRGSGRMYYTEPSMSSDSVSHMESRYDMAKRNYTESKELHRGNTPDDKEHKMKELEKYMREIGSDIAEVISDASPEEKTLLKQKLQVIMQKIQ